MTGRGSSFCAGADFKSRGGPGQPAEPDAPPQAPHERSYATYAPFLSILDVEIPVSVEVGRTELSLDRILDLVPGSVVTLEKKVEEPVDLRVNGKLIARGEVVMVDDVFGIRITQIVETARRIESLRHPD